MESNIDAKRIEMCNNISNTSISKALNTEASIGLYYIEMIKSFGLRTIKSKLDDLIKIVKKCDWTIWFDMAENSKYEWGGSLLYSAELDSHINPIISMGTEYMVHCPGPHTGSIHIHPYASLSAHCIDVSKPSPIDWHACVDKGAQIVVTKWGLFIHEYAGTKHTYNPFRTNDKWKYLDVNLGDFDYRLLFIYKRDLVEGHNEYPDLKFNCCKPIEEMTHYKINNNIPDNITYTPDILSEIIYELNTTIEYVVDTLPKTSQLYKFEKRIKDTIRKMLRIILDTNILKKVIKLHIISVEINLTNINETYQITSIKIRDEDDTHCISFDGETTKYNIEENTEHIPTILDITTMKNKKIIDNEQVLFMFADRYKINFE